MALWWLSVLGLFKQYFCHYLSLYSMFSHIQEMYWCGRFQWVWFWVDVSTTQRAWRNSSTDMACHFAAGTCQICLSVWSVFNLSLPATYYYSGPCQLCIQTGGEAAAPNPWNCQRNVFNLEEHPVVSFRLLSQLCQRHTGQLEQIWYSVKYCRVLQCIHWQSVDWGVFYYELTKVSYHNYLLKVTDRVVCFADWAPFCCLTSR